jgi:TRAP-type C4-dicarboxylate transport system permease large subunit
VPSTREPPVLLEGPITSTLLRLATLFMLAVLGGVFAALGAALAAFGLITGTAVATGAWFGPIVWARPRVLAPEGGQCP